MSYAADAAKACSHTRERVVTMILMQSRECGGRRSRRSLSPHSRLYFVYNFTTRLRMWLHANVILSMDTFCFDKEILHTDIISSSNKNWTIGNGIAKKSTQKQNNRSNRRRICHQTRNERTNHRSLRDNGQTPSNETGEP